MNYHPNQQFGHPPHSPVSQAFAAAATSPGPVQDLSSYINSAASNSADGLGYTANSPQPSAFGHTMPVSANSFLVKKFHRIFKNFPFFNAHYIFFHFTSNYVRKFLVIDYHLVYSYFWFTQLVKALTSCNTIASFH